MNCCTGSRQVPVVLEVPNGGGWKEKGRGRNSGGEEDLFGLLCRVHGQKVFFSFLFCDAKRSGKNYEYCTPPPPLCSPLPATSMYAVGRNVRVCMRVCHFLCSDRLMQKLEFFPLRNLSESSLTGLHMQHLPDSQTRDSR